MGRKTVKDTLEESIELLKTNDVRKHIQACVMLFQEFSMIQGFDQEIQTLLYTYRAFLEHRHADAEQVGIINKIKYWWYSRKDKLFCRDRINHCEIKNYGDGDQFVKIILNLIRKGL